MKLKSAILALSLILGASGMALHAETVAATAQKVNGNVYATDASGKSRKLKTGDIIPVGSLVHTNSGSSALLQLVPGATTVVTPGTDVLIAKLTYSKSANGIKRKIRLTLEDGKLLCSLAKHDGHSDWRIATPMGTSKAVGTDWAISFTPSAGVTVETVDGVVELTLPNGKVVEIPGGQIITSPNGNITITGTLTRGQIDEIKTALGGTNGGGGTFTITVVNSNLSNPANTSSNQIITSNQF